MIPVIIRKVKTDELEVLLELSRQTFFDAFYHLNKAENMEAYATKAFTIERFQQELHNPGSEFYFAEIDGLPAGYIKLNYGAAQSDVNDNISLEIERIYVSAQHQGNHIGAQLFQFALDRAGQKKLKYIWLGVWEHNMRAIKFYRDHGFESFGRHNFMLGSDQQTDLLMKRDV